MKITEVEVVSNEPSDVTGDEDPADCDDIQNDVFLITDENDHDIKHTVYDSLLQSGVTCCTLEDCNGGKCNFSSIGDLMRISRKILFVVSDAFCRSTEAGILAEMAIQIKDATDIICLMMKDVNGLVDRCLLLSYTVKVYLSSSSWFQELLSEIRFIIPEFCKGVLAKNVSTTLHLQGLSTSFLSWDVYGLLVETSRKALFIDIDLYSIHLEKVHKGLDTNKVCGQVKSLRDINTEITLLLNSEFKKGHSLVSSRSNLVELCSSIIDVTSPSVSAKQILWTLACDVEGTFTPQHQEFISRLYQDSDLALKNVYNGALNQPSVPEYTDISARIDSFRGHWPASKRPTAQEMADMGFFFNQKPDYVRCFFCGRIVYAITPETDLVRLHLQLSPSCPYLKTLNIPEDVVRSTLENQIENEKKRDRYSTFNRLYGTIAARKKSYAKFDEKAVADNSSMDNDTNICPPSVDRKKLIDNLSCAGLFYTGFYTTVQCFTCGVIITWSLHHLDDNAWDVHMAYSPGCKFVRKHRPAECKAYDTASKIRGKGVKTKCKFLLKTFDEKPRREWPKQLFFYVQEMPVAEFDQKSRCSWLSKSPAMCTISLLLACVVLVVSYFLNWYISELKIPNRQPN